MPNFQFNKVMISGATMGCVVNGDMSTKVINRTNKTNDIMGHR